MTLEQSLEKIVIEQKNLIEIRRNKDILFSGIEAIDELLSGFEERFKYCFIANEGMGSKVIIDTILKNFSLIYNFRYQWNVDTCILDKLESGEFSMENNYKPFLMVILSEDVMKRKNHNKRPTLNDLPLEIQDNSDVIISIYRPAYYKIETWDNEEQTSTENQIEVAILKHYNLSVNSCKLLLDIENKRVKSIKKNNHFLNKWSNKFNENFDL